MCVYLEGDHGNWELEIVQRVRSVGYKDEYIYVCICLGFIYIYIYLGEAYFWMMWGRRKRGIIITSAWNSNYVSIVCF